MAKRNADLPPDEAQRIAEAIATAAVRYFMVKFSRGKVIVFDIDEALSFEGRAARTCSTRWFAPTTSFTN